MKPAVAVVAKQAVRCGLRLAADGEQMHIAPLHEVSRASPGVNRDGTIVWTFLTPDFEGRRRQLYRMRRVPLERYAAWVASAGGSTP